MTHLEMMNRLTKSGFICIHSEDNTKEKKDKFELWWDKENGILCVLTTFDGKIDKSEFHFEIDVGSSDLEYPSILTAEEAIQRNGVLEMVRNLPFNCRGKLIDRHIPFTTSSYMGVDSIVEPIKTSGLSINKKWQNRSFLWLLNYDESKENQNESLISGSLPQWKIIGKAKAEVINKSHPGFLEFIGKPFEPYE